MSTIVVEIYVDGKLLGKHSSMFMAKIMVEYYKQNFPNLAKKQFRLQEYRITEELVSVETI